MHAHDLVFVSLRVMIKRTIMDKKHSLDNLFAFLTLFLLGFLGLPVLRAQDQGILKLQNDMYHVSIMDVDGVRVLHIEGWLPSLGDPVRIPVRTIELPLAGSTAQRYGVQSVVLDTGFNATPFYYSEFERTSDTTFSTMLRVVPQHLRPTDDYSELRIVSHRIVRRKAGDVLQMVIPLVTVSSDGACSFVRSFELRPLAEDGRAAQIPTVSDIPEFYSDMPFIRRAQGALDTSGTWIDHNETYRKFSVRQDGVYRIDKIWLSQAGYDTSTLDPSDVQLLLRGKPVQLVASGFEDGVFDSTDGFLFHATRNYDPTDHRSVPLLEDDPYPEYLNRYSDSTVYWVHMDAGRGLRANGRSSLPFAVTDTLDWAYQLLHYEENGLLFSYSSRVERIQYAEWTSEDTFWWTWLKGGEHKFVIPTPFVQKGVPARIAARAGTWYGPPGADRSFINTIRLNGSPTLDSIAMPNNSGWVLSATVPPEFVATDTNIITFVNHSTSTNPREFIFDWYEVEYPRRLVASNDELTFEIDTLNGSGPHVIRVIGFSDTNVVVLRSDGQQLTRMHPRMHRMGSQYDALLADTIAAGVSYSFVGSKGGKRPGPTQSRQIVDIRNQVKTADYVVITAEEFLTTCRSYSEMIGQQYGLRTAVVSIDDIYSMYSYGLFNPEAIKVFLYEAASRGSLKYAVLAGDANVHLRATWTKYGRNFVPTYGFPSGDFWFVAFDSLSISPSIGLGRLPFRTNDEIERYHEKHRAHITAGKDEWNKTFMLFSSGDPAEGEATLISYRNVHEAVIRDNITVAPLHGRAVHFYKTITPPTDLGPYDSRYIARAISDGAIMISYIGHSGTQTWDNSIGDVSQLKNARGRHPLISDFGCSTGKYAEPDVIPFAEQFVTDVSGDAIGYLGNSSLGFQSTARVMPQLFIGAIIDNRPQSVGLSHIQAKNELISRYGSGIVNRISVLSSVLIGDPLVRVPIPNIPNFIVRPEWILPESSLYTDRDDSVRMKVVVLNSGTSVEDSISVTVACQYSGTVQYAGNYRISAPLMYDTLAIAIPINGIGGPRSIQVTIDSENQVQEDSEGDNDASVTVHVVSTALRVVNRRLDSDESLWRKVAVLNAMYENKMTGSTSLKLSNRIDMASASEIQMKHRDIVTIVDTIAFDMMHPVAYALVRSSEVGGYVREAGPYAMLNTEHVYGYVATPLRATSSISYSNLGIDSSYYRLTAQTRHLRVISAGWLDGAFGVVEFDGKNYLPTSFLSTYAVVLIDSITWEPYAYTILDIGASIANADSLIRFIDGAKPGTLFAITTSWEPRGGQNRVAPLIRTLGSKYIGTLGDRSSWAMLGWRGAATGSVPEKYSPSTAGRVIIDSTVFLPPDTAIMTISSVGPASIWKHIDIMRSTDPAISVTAEISSASTGVHLVTVPSTAGRIDLSGIDARLHPQLDVKISMYTEGVVDSAYISYIGIAYDDLPELALNYQSVTLEDSTVEQGDSLRIAVGVLNPGEGQAGPFTVALDVVDDQNVRRPLDSVRVSSLGRDAWFNHRFAVNTTSMKGRYLAIISVDRNGEVDEQYEDNNVYMTSFTVRQDTMRPTLDVTFDDAIVFDGDYVRPRPVVRVTLKDLSPLPVTSADNFRIVVNDSLVPTNTGNFRLVETVPYAVLEYLPASDLEAGENIFAFNATDASGNRAYQEDLHTRVRVSYEAGVDRVFSYPNPFTDGTAFSFLLIGSQIPDDASIMVYTVSGRKIKTIDVPPDRLRIGYNVIPWDGRDEDGDRLANGTYFFKVLVRSAGSSLEQIGRIAVLR